MMESDFDEHSAARAGVLECSKTPTLSEMRLYARTDGCVHAWGRHEKRLQVAFRGKALTVVSLLWRFGPS